MVKERYYLIERIKKRYLLDAFNIEIMRQKEGKLEMLSSEVIKAEEYGIKLKKGKVSCADDKYKLEEITKEKAIEILKDVNINFALWRDYMLSSEDRASSHLCGMGEMLY